MRTASLNDSKPDPLKSLRDVTAAAAEIFAEPARLAAAMTYLKRRGIDTTSLGPKWVIGYAPPGWMRLVDRLRADFPEEVMLHAGLARHSSRGTLIDTFRQRVVFGIRDVDGTIAGFIGRDLSDDPNAPKYLNTHRHALFDKSRLLFGLHEGLSNCGTRQVVVVEGPVDVLAIAARKASDGSDELVPVAASGTAFTAAHARAVADAMGNGGSAALVAMDGDPAGRAAAVIAGERLHAAGAQVRVTLLPNGSDPADYLASPDATLDAFRTENGVELIKLYVENAVTGQGDAMQWPEGRLAALRSVAIHLTTYPPDYVARQAGWLADAMQINPATVTLELAAALSRSDLRSAGRSASASV